MAKSYHVAIDIQNLWYSCRYAHGPTYRVDYRALLDFVDEIVNDDDSEVNVFAYLIASPNHDQSSFINTLKMLDMVVKKRNLHYDAEKALSKTLANSVDRVFYLEDDLVYDPKVRHEARQKQYAADA